MKRFKRITALLLALLAVSFLLPFQALAAENIDLNRDVSLTVSYRSGKKPLAGAKFDIFLVATVDKYNELTATKKFSQFNVNIRGKNDKAWRTLASTLKGYVLRDNISHTSSGKTDNKGLVTFPANGKSLKAGLYLVIGYRHTQDGYRYDPAPFMVMLPSADNENNAWDYGVTVNAKFDVSKIPNNTVDDTISRKVMKVWKDDGHEAERPNKVTVQLLRNGKVYDTVTLSFSNNWRHTWKKLDNSYSWTVVEKQEEYYTVEVTQEGNTFVVTNTYDKSTSNKPDGTTGNKLPQTGQLWWPVPMLIAVGLLFIIIGLLRRRGTTDEK